MDIFDGARVLLRWWFVALPILLLTFAASAFVTSGIQPEYTAEGSVLMLGPAVREFEDRPGEFEALNPLIDQPSALESVATVVALSIDGPEVVNILEEEGLSTSFELGTERGLPLVLLQTRAETRSIAIQTAERLVALIDEEVRLRQVAGDVPEIERVTTSVVQLGVVGGADFGGRTRVQILIVALGIGTAFGIAFLLEGLRRRRSNAVGLTETVDEPHPDEPLTDKLRADDQRVDEQRADEPHVDEPRADEPHADESSRQYGSALGSGQSSEPNSASDDGSVERWSTGRRQRRLIGSQQRSSTSTN